MPEHRHVLGEDVAAEVAVEITPDRVHVVAVVLRVVVLDQERRALNLVVMALALLRGALPGELDLLDACRFDLCLSTGGRRSNMERKH